MRSTLCDSGSAVRSNAKLSGCMVMGYLREGKREGERERQTDRQTERERNNYDTETKNNTTRKGNHSGRLS